MSSLDEIAILPLLGSCNLSLHYFLSQLIYTPSFADMQPGSTKKTELPAKRKEPPTPALDLFEGDFPSAESPPQPARSMKTYSNRKRPKRIIPDVLPQKEPELVRNVHYKFQSRVTQNTTWFIVPNIIVDSFCHISTCWVLPVQTA